MQDYLVRLGMNDESCDFLAFKVTARNGTSAFKKACKLYYQKTGCRGYTRPVELLPRETEAGLGERFQTLFMGCFCNETYIGEVYQWNKFLFTSRALEEEYQMNFLIPQSR